MVQYQPAQIQSCVMTTKTATLAESGTKTTAVLMAPFRMGMMYLPAEYNGETITFEVAESLTGTFAAAMDSGGTAISFTANAAPRWYDLPPIVCSSAAFKIVTGTGAGAAATVTLCLKA